MADGASIQTFTKKYDADSVTVIGFESTQVENGVSIVTTYDMNLDVVGVTRTVLFTNLKTLTEMDANFQKAWNELSGYGDLIQATDPRFSQLASGTFIVVNDGGAEVLGRITSWSGENTWTDWQGRTVVNSDYSFNFHDENWNFFGSSGGYERTVEFKVGDRRWDGTTATTAEPITDETGSHLNFRVDANSLDATSWDNLNPGAQLLSKIGITDWSTVAQINVGANSWSQLDTNGATRDEAYDSSNRQLELFNNVEGSIQFAGRLEYRDGIIEVRDTSWQIVGRFLDDSDPSRILTWSNLTDANDPAFRVGLKDAWDEIGRYLPGELRDDPTTVEDERDALRFTVNDWGDLNVFGASGEFLGRINSWEHNGVWRSNAYDEITDQHVPGWTYNTGINYDFVDTEWKHLARGGFEERHFLSDAIVEADYSSVRPANFDEITDPSHTKIVGTTEQSGFVISKDDVGDTLWDSLVETAYGIPNAASGAQGIWNWADVSYLFVQQNTWNSLDLQGTETDSSTQKSVEYHSEGFWWGAGEFVPWSQYDPAVHGENKETLNGARKNIGVIEYRDGFIEVRDGNWQTIGRFVDVNASISFTALAARFSGIDKAWDTVEPYLPDGWDRTNLRYVFDSNGNILVVDPAGNLIGRINSWTNEDTWTDWEGRDVVNSNYSYNFHDADWNYFGSSGGYSRVVSFDAGDRRWDGTTADQATDVLDETGTHINYRVKITDQTTTEWNKLNPGSEILQKLNVTWDQITELNVGGNTWTQLDTNGATRDETYKNSNRQIELFKDQGDWTEFVGRLEYREGMIEVRDVNWNLVGQFLDVNNPNGVLSWDAITDPTNENYRIGLKEAWDEIGKYLPGELRDDPQTPVDERSSLKFTVNQWGDLNVYSSDGLFVARINAWEHSGAWRSQIKDSVTDNWISGWNYRTGTTFNFTDQDWQTLARGGEEKGYFLSDTLIESQYGSVRPLNFEDITDPSHVVLLDLGKQSGFGISKSDVSLDAWDTIIQENYGIPGSASNAQGIWQWQDVSFIFVQDNSWTQYDVQGNTQNENANTNIEFHAEGYWKDGTFVPWSQWNATDGAKETLGNTRQFLGVIEYRDGFIEVRGPHWETIGRFVDVSTAMTYDELISHFQGLDEAWDSVVGYLPSTWDRTALKFTTDSNSNIIAVDETGIMVGRINTWVDSNSWIDWAGRKVINSNYSFNFHDADWGYYGSSGGFTRELEFKVGDRRWDDKLATTDDIVLDEVGTYQNYRVQKVEMDTLKWDELKPSDEILTKLGVANWNEVTEINVGSNSWKQLDTDGATRDEIYQNTSRQIELFKDSGEGWTQFVGRLEYSDGYVEVRDANWDTVARMLDESDPSIIFSWSQLTDPTSEYYQSGLEKAWDDVGKFLPGALRDDTKATPEFDERTLLRFTFDEKGNLAVFGTNGEMVGRIDLWDWDGSWRTSRWDSETDQNVSGWVYSDGTNYNFSTADWNNLARAGDETQYFLTDAMIASDYSGTRPINASGITNLEDLLILQTRQQNGYTIDKSTIGDTAWNLLVDPIYGDQLSTLSIVGLWGWGDITSVFVEQRTEQRFDLDGTLSSESDILQVEYHADGFWSGEGVFTPWSQYVEATHGPKIDLSQTRQLYGSLTYEGGFVEARDGTWETIGREFNGDLFDPDFLGTNTQAIIDNWLSVYGKELAAYLGQPAGSVLAVKQNADGNPVLLADGQALGFGEFRMNNLEGDQQYWSIGAETERGWIDMGGWNETTADPTVLGTVRHGVMFNYDYKPNDPLFLPTLEAYLPPDTVDLTGTAVENFNFYDVAKINAGSWHNDFNGTGEYLIRDYLRYIPKAVDGSDDWGSAIQVNNRNSSYELKTQDGSVVATWIGDITLFDPDFLGADTLPILGNWLSVFGADILGYAGLADGNVSVQQDASGNPLFLIDGVIEAIGEFELREIQDGYQQHWSIHIQTPRGLVDINGWNVVDPDTGIITFEERLGVSFGYDILPGDPVYSMIESEVAFVRDLDLTGTIFDGIDYVNINKFYVSSWSNDFYGDGDFIGGESVMFIPSDASGNDDWSNKLEVKLSNGFVTVGRDNIIVDSQVQIETVTPATNYLDFTRYSDIVDTLLDDGNDLEMASYSIINEEMLGLDVNNDSNIDYFVSNGAIDGNWQPIFEVDTLNQVGGLFQTALQTFMRLPANESSFETWLQSYTPPSDTPAGAFDQAKAQLATLMQSGYEVQVAFNQNEVNLDEKSTGLVFFDASGARVGAVWFNRLAADSSEIDLGGGNVLQTSTDVYADTYSVFQDFIEFEPLVSQLAL